MKSIWLVVDYDWEDTYIQAAFTTEQFAREWSSANPVNRINNRKEYDRKIEEHPIIK